ncbi:efflux RND transporter periplasmic adaptor subunit [Pseudovibrio sp. SPO723]|uniref:efflux RND transporter periplasmic adaptor subunit n=1 Tax=Nesiotobacter zosterae TaxID=392721 RepID=UPI0029C477CC|nr:efflux RND transporter periplasmic adaptor subunit [Pseudovibrio sp. SPO723]MDX5593725.1 efflux RND transporter periplasmic adaptor subunit [Pseudovibrio sp. SPO723]
MSSGSVVIGGQGENDQSVPPPATRISAENEETFSVRVAKFHSQMREAYLELRGRTEADAKVEVRAETTARVAKRPVKEGQQVKPGDLLCVLDRGAREARVLQANALLAQAQLDFEAADQLSGKGFAANNRVAALKAARDAAQAELREAEIELERTEIRSPVEGVVESPMVEMGTILSAGQTCATVVDPNPMLAIGTISETNIGKVYIGQPAEVKLVTGQSVRGTVRYIAPSADPDTRTFRVEVLIPNEDAKVLDGVTALTRLKLAAQKAHFMSPAYLTLNDSGIVGLRGVDENNRVVFYPVEVIGGDRDGVWLTGLPDTATIIVVGQDYVSAGKQVDPVFESLEVN